MPRDYKKEYRTYHGKPKQIARRAARNKARADKGLKKGDGREVDHKKPLSKGGGNSKGNTRVTTRSANRRKYNK
jgi:5-methylcytosine-specific restriction endonuclease McrA